MSDGGDWKELGVRDDTVEAWKQLGFDAFGAALAQGDGYGPAAARHYVTQLKEVAGTWRDAGLASAEGLEWHRAGFGAREAVAWREKGTSLEAAALAAGHRMVG